MEKYFYILGTDLGYLAKYTDLQTAQKTDGGIVRVCNTKGNFCEWLIRNYGIQRDVALEIATKTQTDKSDDWVIMRMNDNGVVFEIYLGNYHFYINDRECNDTPPKIASIGIKELIDTSKKTKELDCVEQESKESKVETKNVKVNVSSEIKYTEPEFTDNEKIALIFDTVKELVIYKNTNYGSAALHPDNIFYKGESANSIKIRLDDKLKRIKNGSNDEKVNDLCDLMGYESLLLVDKMKKQDVISLINKEKD